jgi:hypothetical protein
MKDIEKGRVQGRPLRCRFEIASRGGCQWTRKVNSGINAYLLDSSSSPGATFHLTNCKCLTRHSIEGNHERHAESLCGTAPSVGDARPDTRNPGEVGRSRRHVRNHVCQRPGSRRRRGYCCATGLSHHPGGGGRGSAWRHHQGSSGVPQPTGGVLDEP